ncbi:SWIM zinc finger family protein [Streptomyces humidus]|uniref:SWIM zinc finger family protein n=1 Tax=Streptomyces humidus TaxID=52259 RepID=UPI001E6349B1|nr:SWIM zinc finger family protein [Streptomyces humidus]
MRPEHESSPADEVRRALRAARERRQEPPPGRALAHGQQRSPLTPSATERTPEQQPGRRAEQAARRPADGPSSETRRPHADRTPGGSAPGPSGPSGPADAARAALRRAPGTPSAPTASPTTATSSAAQAPSAAASRTTTPVAPEHTAPEAEGPHAQHVPPAPTTPHVPPTPHVPTGPRPGDVAREALRAARAQARQGSTETGEGTGREGERTGRRTRPRPRPEPRHPGDRLFGDRLHSRAPDPVADERARAVRDLLAGAFRMPTDGTADPDTDAHPTTPTRPEGTPRPATEPTESPRPTEPHASARPAEAGAPARATETRASSAVAETGAATSGTRAGAAARAGVEAPHVTEPAASYPTGSSSTVPSPAAGESAPVGAVEPSRAPRSMAAPSRDGDHRRTFPPFPPRTGGPFAETWWGEAWVAALEEGALDLERLGRGRGYAEQGNVDAITVTPGLVLAYVQGSRPRPYRVQVRLRTLGGDDWERFLDAAVERAGHIAALLDKEMPESLADCGVPLLPGPGDLEPQCSCPDRGHPCKHAAALCYQTARLLDADPFVLLLLRGRGEREVLDDLSRRNAVRAARAAQEQEQQPEPLAGVRAAEALAERRLPPLPAPLPLPAHPEQPPAYPSAPHGPDSFALDHLATDAAARAYALLATGRDEIGGLTLWQDAVRLAASRPGSGLTAATRSLYASLASAAGRTPSELARAVAAWRQGGPEGLTVLEESWDPPAGRFDRARPLLLAADLPAFRPRRNHLTHPRGHVQLRYGQDGLWYAYESEPGHDDWWPRGTPDYDPVGALTGLGGSDGL